MMIRIASLLLTTALLAGCGAHGALRTPATTKAATTKAGSLGERYAISGQGFSAEFPSKPDTATETDEDSVMSTMAAETPANGHGYAL